MEEGLQGPFGPIGAIGPTLPQTQAQALLRSVREAIWMKEEKKRRRRQLVYLAIAILYGTVVFGILVLGSCLWIAR